jgi:anti-anti-sigma factor
VIDPTGPPFVSLLDPVLDEVFDPFSDASGAPCFSVTVSEHALGHLVHPAGELDLGSRAPMYEACTRADHRDVIVDLADLQFMDCAGYGSLVAARHELEGRGGSLGLQRAVDEPLRLIQLVGGTLIGRCPRAARELGHA